MATVEKRLEKVEGIQKKLAKDAARFNKKISKHTQKIEEQNQNIISNQEKFLRVWQGMKGRPALRLDPKPRKNLVMSRKQRTALLRG